MDHQPSAVSKDYLSAHDAVRLLDVRMQTLYAYVSRGWVRSITQPGRKDRLYARADIEKMKARSLARSGHGAVAASAMHWGEPIIPTSITQITPEGPLYRGQLATQLARSGIPFEEVAELLWNGELGAPGLRWPRYVQTERLRRFAASIAAPASNDQLMELFALFTMQLGLSRGNAAGQPGSGDTPAAARELIQTMAGCFGYGSQRRAFYQLRKGQSIVEGLLGALEIADSAENQAALNAALVVLSDHELSPSAFAARIAASSGATLHSCLAAAACTNSGVQIGRLYSQVEQCLARADTRGALFRRASELQARSLAVPGFGHPLYPQGDPRARLLLDLIQRRDGRSKRVDAIEGFIADVQERLGLYPRQELALVLLGIAMGLPKNTSGALFTLARTAGWVAHVREQRLAGTFLRPRAKFVGQA
jgi:citrate synthase